MRTLLLMRGAPGCGKSTWINNNNLKAYTLCADDIRLLIQSPIVDIKGKNSISQANDKEVWSILFRLLEDRLQKGEFTVIDATNSKTCEMNRYRELAEEYRYRIYCVDFTNITSEECKRRNIQRSEHKQVPDEVIDKIYSRFKGQQIPGAIKTIMPDGLENIRVKPIELSEYKKIHFIGDIHGCYTPLKEYLKDIKEDEYYIFCGDYIDRGIENVEVLNYLYEICNLPNICLLEGNHDRYIWEYANDIMTHSKEFNTSTRVELNKKNINKKYLRILYRKLRQCGYYTYKNMILFATHAGISKMPDELLFLSTEQMIKGTGDYSDMSTICDTWDKFNKNIYQIFGHRNIEDLPIRINSTCFNLEGSVEFNGYLRALEIDENGKFSEYMIKNNVKKLISDTNTKENLLPNIKLLVENLRDSKYIKENKFDNISSFNFTREAFNKAIWNDQTVKARGLYINTNTNQIVARSYNKFFNINEVPDTKLGVLKNRLVYPVTAYVKENGFLGIIGYDKESDQLIVTTKSNMNSEYVKYFKDILQEKKVDLDNIKKYVKENNVTLVFEVKDFKNDPHIIEYKENDVILLDIVKNDLQYSKLEYEELTTVAYILNLKCKKKAITLYNNSELFDWYREIMGSNYRYSNNYIEGFVIEDITGFMIKVKLDYYKTWKKMRNVLDSVKRQGYITKTSMLVTKLENDFYNWCKENRGILENNIVSARKQFMEDTGYDLSI